VTRSPMVVFERHICVAGRLYICLHLELYTSAWRKSYFCTVTKHN